MTDPHLTGKVVSNAAMTVAILFILLVPALWTPFLRTQQSPL
jgi:hypothetical protein